MKYLILFLVLALISVNIYCQNNNEKPNVEPSVQRTFSITKTDEQKKADWLKSLKQIAKVEKAAMIFDVNLNAGEPYDNYSTPYGEQGMKRLATVTQRRYFQIKGVQLFSQLMNAEGFKGTTSRQALANLIDWFSSLNETDRHLLIQGKLSMEKLNVNDRDIISQMMCYDPSFAFDSMKYGNKVGLKLTIIPKLEYIDPKTNKVTYTTLSVNMDTETGDQNLKNSTDNNKTLAEEIIPLDQPEIIAANTPFIDFENGEILSLGEIIKMAKTSFNISYEFDSRLKDSTYFVSGKMNKDTFETVIKEVTRIVPLDIPHRKTSQQLEVEMSSLMNTRFAELYTQKLQLGDENYMNSPLGDIAEYGKNSTYKLGDIMKGKADYIMETFVRRGLSPDTMITLKTEVLFVIDAGGMREVNNGGSKCMAQNKVIIGLP